MQQQGIIVYLKAEISTLVHNLQSGLEQRPLLSNTANPEERLTAIYNSRKAVYEQAHHIFAVESLSVADFEPIIQKCIEPH
jgi:shikimate kinase